MSYLRYFGVFLLFLFLAGAASAASEEAWMENFDQLDANLARDMAVNDEGVYVTGRSGRGSEQNILTLKYSSKGELEWREVYDRGNRDDVIDIESGPRNNLYLTARSSDGNLWDYLTLKYGPGGEIKWNRTENLEDGAVDEPNSLAVNSEGAVYVVGSEGFSDNFNYYTVKYSSKGDRQLRKQGFGGEFIGLDGEGNIYLTRGRFGDQFGIRKYNPKLEKTAEKNYNVSRTRIPSNSKYASVDSEGNLYSAAIKTGSQEEFGHILTKYSPDGRKIWEREFRDINSANVSDWPNPVSIGPEGNIYVAGATDTDKSNRQYIYKYSAEGREIWNRSDNIGSISGVTSIDISEEGNIYTAGQMIKIEESNNLTTSYYLAKYTQGERNFLSRITSALNFF